MPEAPATSFDLRLHRFALGVAAFGVVVGLIAAAIHWFAQGAVAMTLLEGVAFAAVAAYPVWKAYRRKLRPAERSDLASA